MLDARAMDQLAGGEDPTLRAELAHRTAATIVRRGRASDDPDVVQRLVALVEDEGLETVAGMWADSPATSLPGALWRLYALRTWVRRDPRTAAERYRVGTGRAEVHDVVAGVVSPPGPEEMCAVVDEVLSGVYTADLAVALERAAAFCRVLAVGSALDADHEADADRAGTITRGAAGLIRTAEELETAAGLWRADALE